MQHCKKESCQYCSRLGNGSGSMKFCDYIGYTGKRRGVYGDDIKNCDKYQQERKSGEQIRSVSDRMSG